MFANVGSPADSGPTSDPYTHVYDYAAGQMVYEGWAKAGVAITDPYWAIRRYTYNGDGTLARSDWCDGNSAQDNVWNNRTSLQYA